MSFRRAQPHAFRDHRHTQTIRMVSYVEAEGKNMADDEADLRLELPQGTLDLLILKAVALEPQHGWGISDRLSQISRSALQVRQGSLYPALHRLQRRGWIKAAWRVTDNNRRAKYYELTVKGRKQLDMETEAWRRLTEAIGSVLRTT
jgi:PadR family transcriptional regulator PadR